MSLSGGQKQRVAIASAIASKRSILFFDEPTSGLDYRHKKEVANVLWQVRDAGITVYVITHDLELILDCYTDIIHLEDGSVSDQYGMDEDGLKKIREDVYKRQTLSGLLSFVVLAITSIMTRFAPGIMTGAYLLSSTSVSEL